MILEVLGLLQEIDAVAEVNLKDKVSSFDYLGEKISFAGDVCLCGKLQRLQSRYYKFTGSVKAVAVLVCGKCMGEYEYEAEFPVELHFSQKEKAIDDDLDMYYTDGDTISFDEAVQTNLIMNIPARRQCSDTCKGVCPHCGVNLNIKCCDCGNKADDFADIDSRFAALKDFFEK